MAEPLATKCCSGIYKDSLIKELRNLRKHEKNVCYFYRFLLQEAII